MITGTYNLVVNPQWRNVQESEVFLECDTTLAPVTINLFEIADLNRFWNVRIVVSDVNNNAGTNNITINANISDTVDEDTTNQIVINTNGSSVSLQVVSDTQWVATESVGGGGTSEYKMAKLPNSSMVLSSLPQPNLVGKAIDLGTIIIQGYPTITLTNGNLATVQYCQSVLEDGTFIYEAYDFETLDPINGYWIAFRQDVVNPNLLLKVAELKMTTQFWNNWYDYTVKDGADNEVQFVTIAYPISDAGNIEGWITTLTYSNGVLTAVDTNPNFGGETVLSLYNSLTGLGILTGNWVAVQPAYILDDDYYGMGVGDDYGWTYYRDQNGAGNDAWATIGFNVLTGQTRYIDAVADGVASVTNFDWASHPTEFKAFYGFASYPSGLGYFIADNNPIDNGKNYNGVTAVWSPFWSDNQQAIYLDSRDYSNGAYIFTVTQPFSGGTLVFGFDNKSFYIVQGNTGNGNSIIATRFDIATRTQKTWLLADLEFNVANGLSWYENNNSLMFHIISGVTNNVYGQQTYYILSENDPFRVQSNGDENPTNMLGSKSITTTNSAGLFRNNYCVGLQVDEFDGVTF
jgi:hypothetical protein